MNTSTDAANTAYEAPQVIDFGTIADNTFGVPGGSGTITQIVFPQAPR